MCGQCSAVATVQLAVTVANVVCWYIHLARASPVRKPKKDCSKRSQQRVQLPSELEPRDTTRPSEASIPHRPSQHDSREDCRAGRTSETCSPVLPV